MSHFIVFYFSFSFSISLISLILNIYFYRKYKSLVLKNYISVNLILTLFFIIVFIRTYIFMIQSNTPLINTLFSYFHNFVSCFIIYYFPVFFHSVIGIPIKKNIKWIFKILILIFLVNITIPFFTESNILSVYEKMHSSFYVTGTLFFLFILYVVIISFSQNKVFHESFNKKMFLSILFIFPELLVILPMDIIRIYFYQADYKISYFYVFFFYTFLNGITIFLIYYEYIRNDHNKKKILAYSEKFLLEFPLSSREKEIAILLLEKKTYNQIKEILSISLKTVEKHVSNLYKKVNVKNREDLIRQIKFFIKKSEQSN